MKTNLVLLLTLLFACSCNQKLVTETNLPVEYLENKEIFNSPTCFSASNIHGVSGFVIRDDQTYKTYADSFRIHPLNSNCDTASLKVIDFNKYTLIGISTDHGVCDVITKGFLRILRKKK